VIDLREVGPSTGSSITCWIGLKAGSAIGRQGLRAERVGRTAADALLAEHARPGEVDRHLADQLLIYLARYGGAYTATARTRHAETVCWLLGTFGLSVDRVTRPDGSEGFSA
jgi:RNA 3'-terminal phosphate cyclase (ATP)